MSDYFHEQMVGKMKLEVTVPIDNNTTFPVKILTEGKAKEMVLKALEDVRAEIEAKMESIIGKYDSNTKPEDMPSKKIERNNGRTEAIDIINRKIKEIKHDKRREV